MPGAKPNALSSVEQNSQQWGRSPCLKVGTPSPFILSGGATPPLTLLGRYRTNDHWPAAGARERDAVASDGLFDEARDRRTGERGRALQENPSRVGGSAQQLLGIRQSLALVEV